MEKEKWLKEFKVYFDGKRTLKYDSFVEFIEFLLAMQKKDIIKELKLSVVDLDALYIGEIERKLWNEYKDNLKKILENL